MSEHELQNNTQQLDKQSFKSSVYKYCYVVPVNKHIEPLTPLYIGYDVSGSLFFGYYTFLSSHSRFSIAN